MDKDAEIKKLTDERDYILGWIQHPITKGIESDSKEEQENAIRLICDVDVDSIGAFFAHFMAVGHLRGLRRHAALVTDKLEEVKEQLKELESTENEH